MSKRILITGGTSGLGKGAALGLARLGHRVIAGAQIWPQVSAMREEVQGLGLEKNLRVEKLDVLDSYDVARALTWDIDVFFSNAGIGEAGPVSEMPLDLVRRNYETNVFAPLGLAQGFIRRWVDEKRKGKIVFTSSMGGLFTPAAFGIYVSTKHALEAVAEALPGELKPRGIQVQTINPGAYLTGYNETMAETAMLWMDDAKNFNKRAEHERIVAELIGNDAGRLDPREMIEAIVRIVPAETGKFRNVVPKAVEDFLKDHQRQAWDNTI